MKILTVFERDNGELAALNPSIVVEMWRQVKECGSKRRKYLAEFNEAERRLIHDYYNKYYAWTMRTGLPEGVTMSPDTYNILKRAGDFFATV